MSCVFCEIVAGRAPATGGPAVIRCHRCHRPLRDGDTAYEQTERQIHISGERANFRDVQVIVCEGCA